METLIETRRTSRVRFGRAAQWLRTGTDLLAGKARGSLADGRGLRTLLAGIGLVGLLGATACALATVSGWLAPVYLLLVVVILTAPRGPRAKPPATGTLSNFSDPGPSVPGRDTGAIQAKWTKLVEGVSRNLRRRFEGVFGSVEAPAMADSVLTEPSPDSSRSSRTASEPCPDAETAPLSSAAESGEDPASAVRRDPGATAPPKPRKSRARSRKAAKPAVEPTADPAPVAWVRVGPGKFVRSDSLPQGQAPVEAPAPAEEPSPIEAPAPVEETLPVEAPALAEAHPPVEARASAEGPAPIEVSTSLGEPPSVGVSTTTEELLPVEVQISAEETPPVEALAPAEVPVVRVHDDPATDPDVSLTADPATLDEVIPAVDVPEADARASEDPATIAPPETVMPVATASPTPESEATPDEPTAEDLPMESPAPEELPDAVPTAEEYGIAPSALGETETAPEVLNVLVPGPLPENRGPLADRGRRPGFPGVRATTRDASFPVARRRNLPGPARRAVRGPARPDSPRRKAGDGPRRWQRGSAARRGSDRTRPVRHPWRARSPPA